VALFLIGSTSPYLQELFDNETSFAKFWETKEFKEKTPEEQAKYILNRMNITQKT